MPAPLAMGKGALGFELDFGYSPNFFESDTSGSGFQFTNDSNVTTLTGNIIVAAPIRGQGRSVRPYVVGGLGLIRANIQSAARVFSAVNKHDVGLDVGAGVMGFFAQNAGLRGDVRYFRGFRGTEGQFTGLALNDFRFWRASLGVSFKF
jgi:opacity protein-like surface antigen